MTTRWEWWCKKMAPLNCTFPAKCAHTSEKKIPDKCTHSRLVKCDWAAFITFFAVFLGVSQQRNHAVSLHPLASHAWMIFMAGFSGMEWWNKSRLKVAQSTSVLAIDCQPCLTDGLCGCRTPLVTSDLVVRAFLPLRYSLPWNSYCYQRLLSTSVG